MSTNLHTHIKMKTIVLAISFLLCLSSVALGQSSHMSDSVRVPSPKGAAVDSDQKRKSSESSARTMNGKPLMGFIDENGDGIDDRLQRMSGQKQGEVKKRDPMHDRFIDMDGDGLNDDRCGGMGITPSKGSKGHGMHK